MSRCVAFGCETETRGQLCRVHARRLRLGLGLPTAADAQRGDRSGFGVFGVVDVAPDGVLCHECGERFVRLGSHVVRAHRLGMGVYRERHGIVRGESLALPVTPGVPRRRPHPCRRCGVSVMVPGKLCEGCRVDRLRVLEERRAAALLPRPPKMRWRELTEAECEALRGAGPEELAVLVPELQLSRVPSVAIGEVLGRGQEWMMRNFPRPDWKTTARR